MSLSGSIEDLPLLEILQVVAYCQKTGHLLVHAPEGEAGVVFRDGRVVSGYIWGDSPPPAETGTPGNGDQVRTRIASILEQLVRLREGDFAFNLTDQVPTRLGDRDLSTQTLPDGINPEELMLDLARKLDEDRREGTASIEASFSLPADETRESARRDEASLEELTAEEVAAAAHQPTVLLVDDEPEVCRVVGRQLANAGFDVVPAGSASHAQREMERLSTQGRRFLLVVDLGLPSASGTSFRGGLDVVRAASGQTTPPPVLLMAEAVDEKLRGRAKRMGVSMIAFKPGLSKLDPLQYEADLRAFSDRLARELLPRLAGRRRSGVSPSTAAPAPTDSQDETARGALLQATLSQIESERDPDMVALLLLRTARSFFARAILFVVKDDSLRGVSGFGPSGVDAPLDLLTRRLTVPLAHESPFAQAVATGRAWSGSLPSEGPVHELLLAIGRLQADVGAILPVRASRQTIALLYADAPYGAALPSIEPFARFVEDAGRALDSALLARRAEPAVAC